MRATGRRGIRVALLLTPLLVAVNAGCEREPPPPAQPAAGQSATQPSDSELAAMRNFVAGNKPPAQPPADQLPPGHPPIAQSMPPGHPPVPASQLSYEVPESWETQQPASSMRKAQFGLPPAEGAAAGELIVFYFGPQGAGGLEANLDRWRNQFTQPDGQPVPDEQVTREEFDVNGLHVSYLEVAGTYSAGAMQMAGQPAEPAEDYRLLSAIVETPDGPWYFKATGPSATMEQHRDEFRAFLQTMRYE